MRKLLLCIAVLLSTITLKAQTWENMLTKKAGTLQVNYYNNFPFFYKDTKTGKLAGIEYDILEEFIKWAQVKKGITITPKYTEYKTFKELTEKIANAGSDQLFAGTITVTVPRSETMLFSSPYMRNVSMVVTNGMEPYYLDEMQAAAALTKKVCYVTESSWHEDMIRKMMAAMGYQGKYTAIPQQFDILDLVAKSNDNYCIVDVVSYWAYLKVKNPYAYLKIQKELSRVNEYFAFAFQKNSDIPRGFNEFMDSGFGFTATQRYKEILERYLGEEVVNTVEIR